MAQEKLLLEHKNKPSKQKILDLDRFYYIKTIDTTFTFKKIEAYSDSSIFIITMSSTGKDSTHFITTKDGSNRDSTFSYSRPIYRQDTLEISFTDIHMLKKDWFENNQWMLPFGWFALGAAMGVVFLPIAAIDDGSEGVESWAIFEAVLIGISAPPIFIGTRKTKYNLKKKWKLKTEN